MKSFSVTPPERRGVLHGTHQQAANVNRRMGGGLKYFFNWSQAWRGLPPFFQTVLSANFRKHKKEHTAVQVDKSDAVLPG